VDPALTQTLDLVHAAQGGDRQALNRLLARYQDRVRRIVRLRLGPALRLQVDSGDILQQVLLDAFRSLDRYQPRDEAGFLAWLATIAEHRIRDAADYHASEKRDAARVQPLETGEAGGASPGATLVDGSPTPPDRVSRAEAVERLEACLAALPEADRELVVLRDYIGLSWQEIAERTGCPSSDAARMRYAAVIIDLGRRMRRGSGEMRR
jgi:RNA polymerase sigma-70 factor (ECF subfamily)